MDSKRLAADYLDTAVEAMKRKRLKARCFPEKQGVASAPGDVDEEAVDAEALMAALAGSAEDEEDEEEA